MVVKNCSYNYLIVEVVKSSYNYQTSSWCPSLTATLTAAAAAAAAAARCRAVSGDHWPLAG